MGEAELKVVQRILFRLLLAAFAVNVTAAELPDSILSGLDATVIAAVADGDFVGGSYASGELAPLFAGYRDRLLLLRRSGDRWWREWLPVSNSVAAPPEVLTLSAGGRTAFVIERLAPRGTGASRIADLAPGRRLFAIALPPGAPATIADSVALGDYPEALDLSPDGRTVAVVSNSGGRSLLHLVPVADNRFAAPQQFDLGEMLEDGREIYASNIHWHPSGRSLAVNLNTRNRVLFLSLRNSDETFSLQPWGEPVAVGTDPFVGRFTPGGRYYITSDWGRDFGAVDLAGRLPEKPSRLSVIRLADPEASEPRHRLLHSVHSGQSAEGLAISADGHLVATVNIRGTPFPEQSPRFQRRASVSLFRFRADAGRLEKVADTPFAGILPEGGAFDPSGKYFLASVFEYRDREGGGIELFRVEEDGLRPLGRIAMPHGAHHIAIAH